MSKNTAKLIIGSLLSTMKHIYILEIVSIIPEKDASPTDN